MELIKTPHVPMSRVLLANSSTQPSVRYLLNPLKEPITIIPNRGDNFIGWLANGEVINGSRSVAEMAVYLHKFTKEELVQIILNLAITETVTEVCTYKKL